MTKGNGKVRELPRGWVKTTIGEVAECLDHKRVPVNKKERANRVGNIPYYGANGLVGWIDDYLFDEPLVLVVEDETFIGREKPFSYKIQGKSWVNNHAHILRPTEVVDINYLNYSLQYYPFIPLTTGTTGRKKLTQKALLSAPYTLPPLNEQKRTSEKIEELVSELDQGIENLKTAQKQLKVYRQAVLKWAFEGKLTEQWRQQAQQQGTLKTGEELLAKIKAERENRYQQQVAEWEVAVKTWEANGKPGKKPSKPSKPSKPKDLSPLTPAELAELPQLPNGWCWVKLGDVTDEPKYGTSKKCTYNAVGRGVLRIPNIGEGLVDRNDLKFAEFDDEEIQTYQLKEGDLLTIRSNGSVSLVGKCALVSERDETFLFAGYLIRIRPHTNSIDSKYLLNCLSSSFLRNQIEGKAKSTSGVNNINSDELKSLKIPICYQLEQEQLVQEIESRLSNCDQLETTISDNLQKAEALRQSILKQAFEGKLVPQDPNDEPAEKLLERIRAEKQSRGNTGKGNQSKQRQLTLPEV